MQSFVFRITQFPCRAYKSINKIRAKEKNYGKNHSKTWADIVKIAFQYFFGQLIPNKKRLN